MTRAKKRDKSKSKGTTLSRDRAKGEPKPRTNDISPNDLLANLREALRVSRLDDYREALETAELLVNDWLGRPGPSETPRRTEAEYSRQLDMCDDKARALLNALAEFVPELKKLAGIASEIDYVGLEFDAKDARRLMVPLLRAQRAIAEAGFSRVDPKTGPKHAARVNLDVLWVLASAGVPTAEIVLLLTPKKQRVDGAGKAIPPSSLDRFHMLKQRIASMRDVAEKSPLGKVKVEEIRAWFAKATSATS